MWDALSVPWQTCLGLAWEAYCDDCFPIGAVVTDANGRIISRGRNRIYEHRVDGPRGNGDVLAHAEVEALRGVDYDSVDPHTCILYTTTEPCPMCMGTFYMSGLRTLSFAARDPFAGSVNMLGTTWYLDRKPIKVNNPPDEKLEIIMIALAVEQDYSLHGGNLHHNDVYRRWAEVIPEGVEFGELLDRSGELRHLRNTGISAEELINRLATLVQ